MKKLNILVILFISSFQLIAGGGKATLEIANDLYSRMAYTKAADFYIKYLDKDSTNSEAWVNLASCYDKVNDYDNLSSTLKTIVTRINPKNDTAILQYAEVQQILGNYDVAATYYQKYNAKNPSDRRAINQLEVCENFTPDPNASSLYDIENMEFNTDAFEYAPSIYRTSLFYTSTSANANASTKVHNWTGSSFSDIQKYAIGHNEVVPNFIHTERLNTLYNDGPFTIDPKTGEFYYTRNNYDPEKAFNKKGLNSQNIMNLKIYIADGALSEDVKHREFAHNSEEYNIGHPTISPDGKYLVFVNDQPENNIGDRDLYFSKRDDLGEWGNPTLLTSGINTEGDELFPHFHEDGTLYFSSDGLGSLGGLDIFKATVDFETNTVVGKVERLPEGMNTTYDDFALIFKNQNEGYFTSDRPSGKGKDDIYHFVDNSLLLKVVVVNAENDSILPGSDLKITNGETIVYEGVTDDSASYETQVLRNQIYDLWADEDYFFENTAKVNTNKNKSKKVVKVKIRLTPVQYDVLVLDAKSNQPIRNATVNVEYLCKQTKDEFSTNFSGKHEIDAFKDCDYSFVVDADGYSQKVETWKSPTDDSNETVTIYLDRDVIVLRNIYYDFDKWNLRLNESFEDLDKIYNFLVENPDLIVEIGSHTDARASFVYNDTLSMKRARSVVNHLVARGIEKSRIVPKGYGEHQVINKCVDNVQCTEEEHQFNRRTEVRILFKTDNSIKIESKERKDIRIDPCLNCPF